jgi:hypothetical protein
MKEEYHQRHFNVSDARIVLVYCIANLIYISLKYLRISI